MSEKKDLPKGAVVPAKAAEWVVGAVANMSAADAFSALNHIVDVVRDSIQIHQTESTKREKVNAYRDMEVARIKSSEKVLREYFDKIFEERRETHKRLFDSLDAALQSGDVVAMQTIVGGIVEVARTSPLANIGNISELRRAMDDPSAVFEF